jgi:hypothetical protein
VLRGERHRVPDDGDQDVLDGFPSTRVAQHDRDVGVEVEGLADGLRRVMRRSK